MHPRPRTAAAVLVAASACLAVPTALAAPKPKPKPITKTYEATAPKPGPDNYATMGDVCDVLPPEPVYSAVEPLQRHNHAFKAPAAGSIDIKLTGAVGDWDLLLEDDKGRNLANSGNTPPVVDERIKFKVKKAMGLNVVACNWAGGPTATVTYTFTFA